MNKKLNSFQILCFGLLALIVVYGFVWGSDSFALFQWRDHANLLRHKFANDLLFHGFPRLYLEVAICFFAVLAAFAFFSKLRKFWWAALVCSSLATGAWIAFYYYFPYERFHEERLANIDYGSLVEKWVNDILQNDDIDGAFQKLERHAFTIDDLNNGSYLVRRSIGAKDARLLKLLIKKGVRSTDWGAELKQALLGGKIDHVKALYPFFEETNLEKSGEYLKVAVQSGSVEKVAFLFENGFRLTHEPGLNLAMFANDNHKDDLAKFIEEELLIADPRDELGKNLDQKIVRAAKLSSGSYLVTGSFTRYGGEKIHCEPIIPVPRCGLDMGRAGKGAEKCEAGLENKAADSAFCVIQINADGTWDNRWDGKPFPAQNEFSRYLEFDQDHSQESNSVRLKATPDGKTLGSFILVGLDKTGKKDSRFKPFHYKGRWFFFQIEKKIVGVSEDGRFARMDGFGNVESGFPCQVFDLPRDISWAAQFKDISFIPLWKWGSWQELDSLMKVGSECQMDQEFSKNVGQIGIRSLLGIRETESQKYQLLTYDHVLGGTSLTKFAVIRPNGSLDQSGTKKLVDAIEHAQLGDLDGCTFGGIQQSDRHPVLALTCDSKGDVTVPIEELEFAD